MAYFSPNQTPGFVDFSSSQDFPSQRTFSNQEVPFDFSLSSNQSSSIKDFPEFFKNLNGYKLNF